MTVADVSIILFCVVVWLTMIVRACREESHAGLGSQAFGIQMKVRNAVQPLKYTALARAECAQSGLNREWVEAAVAFPAASGAGPGNRVLWFVREFGNRRIKIWVIDSPGDNSPVVTRVEVTASPAHWWSPRRMRRRMVALSRRGHA